MRLTDKGRELKPAFIAISDGLQDIIRSKLSQEEAEQLETLLAKCVE